MDYSVPEVTSAEREFYGENLILLEGAISEFLSCMDMIRRYEVQLGNRDPVASFQTRLKSAESMRQKLQRLAFPVTAESALKNVFDAAGVRLVCPFIQDTESGHDDRRLSPVPHGDPHLHAAPWTLCDNISWFISYHGKQPILGESRSCRSIRDPSLLADGTAKDLAYFLFHGASLSLFSFLRTAS